MATEQHNSEEQVDLLVEGMTCAACVGRVERALKTDAGVSDATVNLASSKATVTFQNGKDVGSLIQRIEEAGYNATYIEPEADRHDIVEKQKQAEEKEKQGLKRRLLTAAILTVPIFLLDMLPMTIPAIGYWLHSIVSMQSMHYFFFLLASIVQFGPGLRFYRLGFPALVHGSPDMNSLVMLGTTAAYSYSVVATFLPSILPEGMAHTYFEAAAVIITLVLLGRYMEALARGKTGDAIRKLMNLAPETALRKIAQSSSTGIEHSESIDKYEQVKVADLRPGDVILIRPGESLPVDGIVTYGKGMLDQSMMTGEPVPVEKETGAEVIGGTINQQGSFEMEIERIGKDTVLSRIIDMVEGAQAGKLPIQAVADRVVKYFVPAVLVLASLTFIIWLFAGPQGALTFALVNAVAVLIIACPCAMGLATPTSIMVGTGRAAENGVLFRSGQALQKLSEVKTIAFDKTGTLTEGRPAVVDFILTDKKGDGYTEKQNVSDDEKIEILTAIASLEMQSEHPLATALVRLAETQNISFEKVINFENHTGSGVSGQVNGQFVRVESAKNCPDSLRPTVDNLSEDGKTVMLGWINNSVVAIFAVKDPLRYTAKQTIAALHQRGYKTVMLTGDREVTALAVAAELGIFDVRAGLMPEDKLKIVEEFRNEGILFAGDGINDAPALAAADVGMAVGGGTDIARESADVVLMSEDPTSIVSAVDFARATMRNIKQNLFWAFAYNTALIPVAAGILYPFYGILLSPVFAAVAMGLSSLFVLGNALRLKSVRGFNLARA